MIRIISGVILFLLSLSGFIGYFISGTQHASRWVFEMPFFMVLFYFGPLAGIGAMLFYFGWHSRKSHKKTDLKEASEFLFNRKRYVILSILMFLGGIIGALIIYIFSSVFINEPEFASIRELFQVIITVGLYATAILTSLAPVILWQGLLIRNVSLNKETLCIQQVSGELVFDIHNDLVSKNDSKNNLIYIFKNKQKKFILIPNNYKNSESLGELLTKILV